MRLLAAFLALLLTTALALACEDDEEGPAVTVSPPTTMTAIPQATASPAATITATPGATPRACAPRSHASEPGDEYEGWLTYTNDVYGYEFRYPPEATVTEAPETWFHLSREEYEKGVTFHDAYERYTGKICVQVEYQLGWVNISAPVNDQFRYVNCGITGIGYDGRAVHETLLIDGKTYSGGGWESQGPGETLRYHHEFLILDLDDGTKIEYGARPVETATFEDYLQIRDDLVKIVQSYRKVP